jgi:AraC-like DNA-binding protein
LLHLPQRHFRGGGDLKKTLHRIFAAFDRRGDSLRAVALQNLLLRFLLDVLEASGRTALVQSSLIRNVQQFVAEHLDRPLTVPKLARVAGLSTSRLKARFKGEVGMSPADYVMRQKIERAKTLLLARAASVTGVAMHLGFSTPQYFATVFKRYTGQTPSSYQRHRDMGGE